MFYFSHLLYVIYWVLLIFHAPNFWKWFVGPCAIFLIEKIFRVARSLSEEGKTWVTMGVVLPSKVVSLVIRRPPHFTFKPGDYIFINIPVIATFEWHPFTIRWLYLLSFRLNNLHFGKEGLKTFYIHSMAKPLDNFESKVSHKYDQM